MKFLSMIPDDVHCNIHGEYNGIGYECLVDVWCGKYLIHGWKDKIDHGSSIEDVLFSYVSNNWKCVSCEHDDDLVKDAFFDAYIDEAHEALNIDWDAKLKKEVEEYIECKPDEKQISLANAINLALNKHEYFSKNATRAEYDKFIKENLIEYKKWIEQNKPSNFGY